MARDILFKTSAFGGFKKDEVMNYISMILAEKDQLEKQLAANKEQTVQLNTRLSQIQSEKDDVAKLKCDLAEATEKLAEYEASLEDKDRLILELTQCADKASLNDEVEEELNALRTENIKLKEEIERKRDLERQVGAAMLDARVHSEELVQEAKERANNVTKSVYAAIGETAVKIDDLSAGIGEIARSFTKSVEEVELRIKVLTGNMSKTAQALIADNSTVEGIVSEGFPTVSEYDFSKPVINDDIDLNDA